MSQLGVEAPRAILRSSTSSVETRALVREALLSDIPVMVVDPVECTNPSNGLAFSPADLRACLPVGSVEFVRALMQRADVREPISLCKPVCLDPFLGRRIDLLPLDLVRAPRDGVFIKPVATKLFNGFVWRPHLRDSELSAHDLEQVQALRSLAPDTMVLASEVVSFQSEWRFYVHQHDVVGAARYDQVGAEDAPQPDTSMVKVAAAAMRARFEESCGHACPLGYSLDFGVLADGRTVLVEANDGWALGLYSGTQGGTQSGSDSGTRSGTHSVTPSAYMQLLWDRWQQIGDV